MAAHFFAQGSGSLQKLLTIFVVSFEAEGCPRKATAHTYSKYKERAFCCRPELKSGKFLRNGIEQEARADC